MAAFVIWLVHRDGSPTVAAHALRSIVYQIVWLSAIFIGWSITFALMAVLVGFLLVPVMVARDARTLRPGLLRGVQGLQGRAAVATHA